MATKHKISNQPRESSVNKRDLLLISKTLNAPYDTQWKSNAITFETLEEQIEQLYRNENFKDELDELYDISEKYLHSANLTIDLTNDNKIRLLDSGTPFSQIDASDFVKHGMLKDARIEGDNLVIIFELYDGKEKKVTVPLSKFIDIYYAGNGLCCENKTFRINTDIVSTIGHKHTTNDITDISDYVAKSDNLSIINNNEISNYVKNGVNPVIIGKNNISAANNAIVIDTGSVNKNNGTTSIAFGHDPIASKTYSIAIGAGAHAYGAQSIAIGKSSTVNENISSAIQLGWGTNNESNSLQFRNTQIVNSNGVIPNKSLELSSVNGILSGDGKGNIVSANIEIDHLSSIENNEISNYVRNDEYSIKIGKGSSASGGGNIVVGSGTAKANGVNAIAIGKDSNSARNYSVSIGSSSQAAGVNSVAIGSSAIVKSNINYACQIGQGTNNEVSSLQFLNTTVVNSSGVIPNKSLELSSVNGILSGDGKGNITSTDILNKYEKIENLKSAAYILSTAFALSNHNHDDQYLNKHALDTLSIHWESAWTRISAATNGLTANIGNIAYKNSLSTSDIKGYKDTTYTAGNGLSIDNNNVISLTASGGGGVTYDYVKNNLSSDGYCVTFIDWED